MPIFSTCWSLEGQGERHSDGEVPSGCVVGQSGGDGHVGDGELDRRLATSVTLRQILRTWDALLVHPAPVVLDPVVAWAMHDSDTHWRSPYVVSGEVRAVNRPAGQNAGCSARSIWMVKRLPASAIRSRPVSTAPRRTRPGSGTD